MIDPEKIWDFLDFAAIPSGGWDPSLAFVMGGGVLVVFVGCASTAGSRKPVAAPAFVRPDRTHRIDANWSLGAAIFGVGWGLSGFCPGPAFADLGLVPGDVWLFVVAMVAGSWVAGQFLDAPRGVHVRPSRRNGRMSGNARDARSPLSARGRSGSPRRCCLPTPAIEVALVAPASPPPTGAPPPCSPVRSRCWSASASGRRSRPAPRRSAPCASSTAPAA